MRRTRLTTLTASALSLGLLLIACGKKDKDNDSTGDGDGDGDGDVGDGDGDMTGDGDMAGDGDGDTPEMCDPGETRCAGDKVVETCLNDGESWFASSCDNGTMCVDGECQLSGTCSPGHSVCEGGDTRVTCTSDGAGYEKVECPDGIPCIDGQCAGPVCNVGATRCSAEATSDLLFWEAGYSPYVDLGYVERCEDGTAWVREECGSGEVCTYDKVADYDKNQIALELMQFWESGDVSDMPSAPEVLPGATAACTQPECNSYFLDFFEGGGKVCGDPTDSTVDPTTHYTVCENVAPFGKPTANTTECPVGANCIPWAGEACQYFEGCEPGTTECDGRGLRTCLEDGTWGPAETCMDGDRVIDCVEIPYASAGYTDYEATCMDAVCGEWMYVDFFEGTYNAATDGACTPDGQLITCDEDGMVEEPVDCPDNGFCDGYNSYYDGYEQGSCETQCTDGEEDCTTGGGYRVCVDGRWEPASCGGKTCHQVNDEVYCGECVPGRTQCNDGQLQTCTSEGVWGTPVDCDYGVCTSTDLGDYTGGACLGQCAEDRYECSGYTQARQCANGVWGDFTACGEGLACRVNSQNDSVGCVECVGGDVGGNYSYGVADQTCDEAGLITCQDDNTWGDAVACEDGFSCDTWTSYSSTEIYYSQYAGCIENEVAVEVK